MKLEFAAYSTVPGLVCPICHDDSGNLTAVIRIGETHTWSEGPVEITEKDLDAVLGYAAECGCLISSSQWALRLTPKTDHCDGTPVDYLTEWKESAPHD